MPDADIRRNVIDTFLAAADGEKPEKSLVSEHSVTLVNAMLKNSKIAEMPSTVRNGLFVKMTLFEQRVLQTVRTSALRYLGVLPSIVRYDVLHPYRANVLRELSTVLDDPKRSVRKEAVDARFVEHFNMSTVLTYFTGPFGKQFPFSTVIVTY